MTYEQFCNLESDLLHFFIAVTAVLTGHILKIQAWWVVPSAILIYATVKEFIIDILFETKEESGGVIGGIRDWVGYFLGTATAAAFLFWKG